MSAITELPYRGRLWKQLESEGGGGEGAILNSKGEFNRSHIPRLVLEEKEEVDEETRRREQMATDKELSKWLEDWEGSQTRNKR